jgi:hypothetical protein
MSITFEISKGCDQREKVKNIFLFLHHTDMYLMTIFCVLVKNIENEKSIDIFKNL